MKKTKKTKKWRKFRHKIVFKVLAFILTPIMRIKYGFRPQKFKAQGKRNYLIISNHQTSFDQFFVCKVFKGPVYFIASEDLFSNGLVSKLINYLVAPIPIKKQLTDMRAVMTSAKIAKEGGSIALFPEGNRTFSGTTEYFKESIVKLAKLINLPIALVRIEGGYGVEPRWAKKTRKGKCSAYVYKVLEPEDYKNLSEEQLFQLISQSIFVDDRASNEKFKSNRLAEYLERAVYVCPNCGLSSFRSDKNTIKCLKCGLTARYNPDKTLSGIDKPFPFNSVKEWYDYQQKFINELPLTELIDAPLYTDSVRFSEVKLYKKKIKLEKHANACLYANKITVSGKKHSFEFEFSSLSAVTVLGRNKVNLYFNDKVYQIKPQKRFNALRYVHFYNRYMNIKEGKNNEFLGI